MVSIGNTRWKWAVNITWPLHTWEQSPVPIKEEALWAWETVWTIHKREKPLSPASIQKPSHYTELSRFLRKLE